VSYTPPSVIQAHRHRFPFLSSKLIGIVSLLHFWLVLKIEVDNDAVITEVFGNLSDSKEIELISHISYFNDVIIDIGLVWSSDLD